MAPTSVSTSEYTAADQEFVNVLAAAVTALNVARIPYGIIGGVASAAFGRPRCTNDIDIFCRVEDASGVLDVLGREGFAVEQTNPAWIYKGFRENVVVDVIFKAKADIYFDDEMQARVRRRTVWGVEVPLAPPEDVIVMKAIATDESSPAHWWDALCMLSANELDWEYLLERSRKGLNRVASLLHFALSSDIAIPTPVVRQLDEALSASWSP